jgi:hypothetical protein
MKHFHKIADGIDVAPLVAQIEEHPELWDSINFRKVAPGTAHSRMSDIWIRYNDISKFADGDLRGMSDEHVPIWYPAWHVLPALHPIVFGLMAAVSGEMIGGVLITRVPAGECIAPHTDAGWHVNYYDKFYVCLKGGPGRRFCCEDASGMDVSEPMPGDIHLFDNRKPHWVENDSDEDRMTLIVCIRTAMFRGGPLHAL